MYRSICKSDDQNVCINAHCDRHLLTTQSIQVLYL